MEGLGEMGVKETEDKVPVLLEFTIQWGKQTVKAIHQVIHNAVEWLMKKNSKGN